VAIGCVLLVLPVGLIGLIYILVGWFRGGVLFSDAGLPVHPQIDIGDIIVGVACLVFASALLTIAVIMQRPRL